MTIYDKQFKSTALKLGACLLCFLLLFETFLGSIQSILWSLLLAAFGEEIAFDISEIINGILYLLAFSLPALLYRLIAKNDEKRPLELKKAPPKELLLILFAIIGINLCCSQLNSMLVSGFEFYDYMQSLLEPDKPMDAVDFLIAAFGTALVPAICEELLFRATVLRSLAPYGKTFAVISSAVLFGLMHQNPVQIFYATAAEILLGFAYVKTNSYLCVFLIHFINNLLSVFADLLLSNLEEQRAFEIYIPIQTLVVLIGFLSAILLIIINSKKKTPYDTGSYGTILEEAYGYNERKVSFAAAKKFFLSPTVLIFTILCIINTLSWFFLPLNS